MNATGFDRNRALECADMSALPKAVTCRRSPNSACEIHYVAVHRHEWAERPLAEGDRIEFIRVVAGG
jgi:sulfur carrier protein ThiS